MNRKSTLFLKAVLLFMGAVILVFAAVGLFQLFRNPVSPDYAHILYPALVIIYLSAVPFWAALYQAFCLLCNIDHERAFSAASVRSLRAIQFWGMIFSLLYTVMMPLVFMMADKDDAPGLVLFGTLPVFAGLVITVFAAVLKKLLAQAIAMKEENDLTV